MPGVERSTVGSRWDTARTEAFSDGVFAIAITLLVLDIGVPGSDFNHLWRATAHQWPSYLGYATSFLTVGGIWLVHHRIFRRLQYANRRVMEINLVLLMRSRSCRSRPSSWPSRSAIRPLSAPRSSSIGASLLVISLLFSALWGTVASDRSLLKPEVSEKEGNAIARARTPNLGFSLAVIVLAFLAPKVAAFGYLLIAIVAALRARGDDAPTPTTAGSA